MFIVIVKDEGMADQITNQVPWGVMNQNFSIKRWPDDLSLEEIKLDLILLWIQMKGLPVNLTTEVNDRRLANKVGKFIELEDLKCAKDFLRARILVDTK